MSLTAALVLIAQSTAPAAAAAPVEGATAVAEQARASVTVLRPAQVRVDADGEARMQGEASVANVQRHRDDAGTVWFEFS